MLTGLLVVFPKVFLVLVVSYCAIFRPKLLTAAFKEASKFPEFWDTTGEILSWHILESTCSFNDWISPQGPITWQVHLICLSEGIEYYTPEPQTSWWPSIDASWIIIIIPSMCVAGLAQIETCPLLALVWSPHESFPQCSSCATACRFPPGVLTVSVSHHATLQWVWVPLHFISHTGRISETL